MELASETQLLESFKLIGESLTTLSAEIKTIRSDIDYIKKRVKWEHIKIQVDREKHKNGMCCGGK